MYHVEIFNQLTLENAGLLLGLKKSQVANIKSGKRELTVLEALLLQQSQDERLLNFFFWIPDDKIFWSNIEKLQSELKFNDESMSKLFSCSLRLFRHSRAIVKSLPWSSCESFNKRYKTHPALWLTRDIDITCIANNIQSPFKSYAYIPSRFEGGGSKMRLLSNLVDYVCLRWGDDAGEAMKSSLQITDEALNFEKSISIRTFSEFHSRLRAFGATDRDFELIGEHNRSNHKNYRFFSQKAPRNCRTFNTIFSYFIDNLVSKIDVNRRFKIVKNTKNEIQVLTEPTDVFFAAYLPETPFSELEIALFIKGHIKVIPTYFGLAEFDIVELEFNKNDGSALYRCKIPSN